MLWISRIPYCGGFFNFWDQSSSSQLCSCNLSVSYLDSRNAWARKVPSVASVQCEHSKESVLWKSLRTRPRQKTILLCEHSLRHLKRKGYKLENMTVSTLQNLPNLFPVIIKVSTFPPFTETSVNIDLMKLQTWYLTTEWVSEPTGDQHSPILSIFHFPRALSCKS